jgi:hypothetical protein
MANKHPDSTQGVVGGDNSTSRADDAPPGPEVRKPFKVIHLEFDASKVVPQPPAATVAGEAAAPIIERLERIEAALGLLVERETAKEWYSTEEFARAVSKAEFTVREWCRLGRLKAEKKRTGRGMHKSWAIAHEELARFRREGLLPLRP